jgi:hypothetical protein
MLILIVFQEEIAILRAKLGGFPRNHLFLGLEYQHTRRPGIGPQHGQDLLANVLGELQLIHAQIRCARPFAWVLSQARQPCNKHAPLGVFTQKNNKHGSPATNTHLFVSLPKKNKHGSPATNTHPFTHSRILVFFLR